MPIKLATIKKPISTLKHKFLCHSGRFKEISDEVLTLRKSIDVIIVKNCVYMLSLNGEKLFNMERAYKKTCEDKLGLIQMSNIMTDFDKFTVFARSNHNPRKFLAFNKEHLDMMDDVIFRRHIAKTFDG